MNKTEHLFFKAAEESGEVAQISSKCAIFGVQDSNPKYGNIPNIELFIAEVNDLIAVVEMIGDEGIDISNLGDRELIRLKKEKVKLWMEYSRDRGRLSE